MWIHQDTSGCFSLVSKPPQGEQGLGTLVSLQDWVTYTQLCPSPGGILAYESGGHMRPPGTKIDKAVWMSWDWWGWTGAGYMVDRTDSF